MSNEVDELAELVRAMVREELAELGVRAGVVAIPTQTSVEERLSRLESAIKPRQQLVAR